MDAIPHTPWHIAERPTDSGLSIIQNGTEDGVCIAMCEHHIAEFIIKTVNDAHQQPG